MNRYPLASNTWNNEEIDAIQQVVDSKMFTMGRHVAEYEQAFAKFFDTKYAVMVNSGSSANLLMIASLFLTKKPFLKQGDEVIVPAVSWSTTYFPLQQYGLKVKFVDVDRNSLNIDVDKLGNAITNKTKAILLVNLLGNPNDFEEIERIIINKDILLLEDNCESMGAKYKGKHAGTFGLMGTYSSFFSHHISTMEGGCIVTDNKELYHVLLCIRAHGWTRNLPKINEVTGVKNDDPFEESFKFILPGYNFRPLEMSGAVGKEQLKKLPDFINMRRNNAHFFKELFQNHPYIQIQQEIDFSSWFGFSLVIKEGAPFNRKQLIQLLNEKQIECRPIVTGNFLKNKDVLRFFNYEVFGSHESADYIDFNGLFVGNHHNDIREQITLLYQTVNKIK